MGFIARSRVLAVRSVEQAGIVGRWVYYQCPRCDNVHGLPVDYKNSIGATWSWDGNMEAPTLGPSVLSKSGPNGATSCHHFVKGGKIEYCGDTPPNVETGEVFAGRTVDLPELPEYMHKE